MGSTQVTPPRRSRFDRDWNQRSVVNICARQRLLGGSNGPIADPSQQVDALHPAPFNTPTEAPEICCAHQVNLADMLSHDPHFGS